MSGTARELDERLGEGLYKALFDSAVVGLTLCDGDRRVIECNDAYCRIVGRARDEVIGRLGPDFDEPGQPDITGPPMKALTEGLIESYRAEKRYVRPDRTVVPVRVTMSAVSRDADRYVGIVEDLSAVFEAQVELRSQAALLERAQEVGGVGSFVWYPATNRNTWSPHARRIFGFTDEQADTGDPALFFDAVHPDDRERVATATWRAYEQGSFTSSEYRFIRPSDGETRWIHGQAVVEGDRMLGAVTDITDVRRAEAELQRQSALLERAQAIGGVGTFVWDSATNRTEWSPVTRQIYGFTDEVADTGEPGLFWNIVHPDDREEIERRQAEALRTCSPYEAEHRIVRPDGEVRWVRARSEVESSPEGQRQIGVVIDITPSRVARDELTEQKALLERAQEVGGVGSWAWYALDNRNVWSGQARRIFGLTEEEAATDDVELFFAMIHPEDTGLRHRETFTSADEPTTIEYRIIRRSDGEVRWMRETGVLERGEDGQPLRILGAIADITEQRLADESLSEQSAALQRAHELARLGRFTIDIPGRTVMFSDEVARLLGADSPEMLRDIAAFRARFIHEEDLDHWSSSAEEAYTRAGPFAWESRMRRVDGEVIWARIHGSTEVDETGRPVRAVGVVQDVTQQHGLEEQLLQAQKLEAVGQLAGGVAHDFNNLLTVIVGNVELALSTARGPDATFPDEDMHEVLRAAERAGELVKQLLAFSRSDSAQARVVDLNAAVQGIRRMLMRLLEENIRVQATLIEAETPVLVDPGQLEQVLLNLAVNARDAMPGGGRLTIATHADSDHVTLRVSDTGVGMDDAVRARIFDPFYTTKPPGEGTGLGLSTVYGIVTKAGGSIEVESAPAAGTTFTVVFPRATGPVAVADDAAADVRPSTGGERILIVEDDDMVRTVAAQILARTGYDVVTAENGREALDLLGGGQHFDLMVSDLMMPTLTGIQLADELRDRGVTIPVVYTSGYAEGVTARMPQGPGTAFLPKPFTREELTAAVRRLLDS